MLSFKLQRNSRFLVLGFFGTLLAFCGYLTYTFDPLQAIVKVVSVMSPSSILFKLWTKPPLEVYINVYIFNVTNSKEFLAGEEKIKLEELGPYVYQEILSNNNGTFNPNGTLTFEPMRHLVFNRERSVGDPNVDTIMSPNIPLLGISSFVKDASFFVKFALSQLSNTLNTQVFLNLTVSEYLWGYDDRLVKLANLALPGWINFKRFGILDRLMALDNDTNVVTIKNWDEKSNDQYSIQEFNGSPGLHQWGYDDVADDNETNTECNTLRGSYVEGIFPKNMNPNCTMKLYRRAFCRPVNFLFEDFGKVEDYDTIDYRVNPNFLGTPEENPDNACYCKKGACPKRGLGNVAPCYYGIPIAISQPHFYNSDPSFLEQVDGLTPNKEKHDTTIKIHKNLGVPLAADLRIQINLQVDTKYSVKCEPFNGLTLPLFWLELKIDRIPTVIKVMLTMLYDVLPIAQQVCMWLLMLFGIAMVAAAALFTLYGPRNYGLEDPYDNRIGYSPIRIIPVTHYLSPPTIRISK